MSEKFASGLALGDVVREWGIVRDIQRDGNECVITFEHWSGMLTREWPGWVTCELSSHPASLYEYNADDRGE